MKHIDELIETLEMVSQMLADHEDAEPEDGRLEMRAAGQLRRLKTALEDANGICRSAMAIAERGGRETNWDAFTGQLRESLQRQHAVMYPPENAKCAATGSERKDHE